MPILPWACAHGEPPAVTLDVASTVAISPPDDSVDTNSVVIVGEGTINSFGVCDCPITKRVAFLPVGVAGAATQAGPPSIVLVNSVALNLLGKNDRTITVQSYGEYSCDGNDVWTETAFTATGVALTEVRVNELEQRVTDLEARLTEVELILKSNSPQSTRE